MPSDDLAGGEGLDWQTRQSADYFALQIKNIAKFRATATVVAMIVLASLIWALACTVLSFTRQIDKATPAVNLKELVASAKAEKPAASLGGSPAPAAAPVSVNTSVSVDISSIGNSVVAVVTVLVLAIAVLAIALLRITYSLSVDGVGEGRLSEGRKHKDGDAGIVLPGAELVKAVGEALATVLKGVPGKKD
ncbi:hypothetical protein [Pseudoduganella namucuonensis]|uniref:hypothetical protein n=1 Tax=Pseudoduganella namucuonensis TaxID=1035707 RepID=UPI0011604D5D|nr:hypothetical protein [Pseudoduganella namucuonensis]